MAQEIREQGFNVDKVEKASNESSVPLAGQLVSQFLHPGEIYTREQLADKFAITDRTLFTGIFQPKGSRSIWLFVTEDKTSDRTQYKDRLDGDLLYWQGQTSGRKDRLIIEHVDNDNELLLFYRKSKDQYLGYGFRYEGRFRYRHHHGAGPTSFELVRETDASRALACELGSLAGPIE